MNKGECEIQSQNLLNIRGKFSNLYLGKLVYICNKNKT